jgi:hypothetical protein
LCKHVLSLVAFWVSRQQGHWWTQLLYGYVSLLCLCGPGEFSHRVELVPNLVNPTRHLAQLGHQMDGDSFISWIPALASRRGTLACSTGSLIRSCRTVFYKWSSRFTRPSFRYVSVQSSLLRLSCSEAPWKKRQSLRRISVTRL